MRRSVTMAAAESSVDDGDDDAVAAAVVVDDDACCCCSSPMGVGRCADESAFSGPAARDPIIRRHLMRTTRRTASRTAAAETDARRASSHSPKMSRHASRPDRRRRPWWLSIERHRSVCTDTHTNNEIRHTSVVGVVQNVYINNTIMINYTFGFVVYAEPTVVRVYTN